MPILSAENREQSFKKIDKISGRGVGGNSSSISCNEGWRSLLSKIDIVFSSC